MVAPAGIEPATQGFSVLCSTDWAIEPKKWRFRRGLNPRSTAWQAGMLTATPRNQWLRELDLNQRPSGYEPDELPDCSIPRYIRWRRKRDSNPCAAFTTSRFSRPVPSTRLGYSSTWCLRPDLNRHGLFARRILSPVRLPISPLRHNVSSFQIRLFKYILFFLIWQAFFLFFLIFFHFLNKLFKKVLYLYYLYSIFYHYLLIL